MSHTAADAATTADRYSQSSQISADGSRVLFHSYATNLAPGVTDTNGSVDLFVYDIAAGTASLVSHTTDPSVAAGGSYSWSASMSGDGARIVFSTGASNLVSGVTDANQAEDVYLYETATGALTLVSHAAGASTTTANFHSYSPSISRDGSTIVFQTFATDLVSGVSDSNQVTDVYAYDVASGAVRLLSHTGHLLTTVDGPTGVLGLSQDGTRILLRSPASDFAGAVAGNGKEQVYLYDTSAQRIAIVSQAGGFPANFGVSDGQMSSDGSYVAFLSHSTNLVANDFDIAWTQFGVAFNLPPSGLALVGDTLPENRPIGTLVGTLIADDDQGQAGLVYELVSGEGDGDNARFTIVGNQLFTDELLDYEAQTAYAVRVRVSDAEDLSVTRTFTIHVTDVDEAPKITQVLASGKAIAPGARLLEEITQLTARFSLEMSTSGGASGAHSVTNPANWMLTKNGTDVSDQIAAIDFGFNALTGRHEAVLTFTAPLTAGDYVLTALDAIQDVDGHPLDGDADNTAGGDYSLDFRIRVPQAVGPEFRVNTYITGLQQFEKEATRTVAMDAAGNFVVVWSSLSQDGGADLVGNPNTTFGVFAQRFDALGNPLGAEFQVNTRTAGNQYQATVDMSPSGDFVITWHDDYNDDGFPGKIFARRYNAAGEPQGDEFQVNTFSFYNSNPSVALADDGRFVITWNNYLWAEIRGQIFAADGNRIGGEFEVNSFQVAPNQAVNSSVAIDADGDFVVTWTSGYMQETGTHLGGTTGIYGQRFNRFGQRLGPEFRVNTTIAGDQTSSMVAMDAAGNFVVTWTSDGQDGDGEGVYAQRYNADGIRLGDEFQVHTTTTDYQRDSRIAMSRNGDFVIVWWSSIGPYESSIGVFGQRFNAAGVPQGAEFRIDDYDRGRGNASGQRYPAAAMAADGSDFVVVWSSYGQDDWSYGGIYAQRFATGSPPTEIGLSPAAVEEDAALGTLVGLLRADDVDAQDTFTFELATGIGSGDNARFAIVDNELRTAGTFDFESRPSVSIRVRVTDSDARTFERILHIKVNGVNEPPLVADVLVTGASVQPGGRLVRTVPQIVVSFTDDMSVAGGTGGASSITNTANWQLTRDGIDANHLIASIAYSLNLNTNQYEALLTFTTPLGVGDYVLTATDALQDLRHVIRAWSVSDG
ncbi:MAG: cadherin domain-containing protein, partial [Planctomycetaceae bacterium]